MKTGGGGASNGRWTVSRATVAEAQVEASLDGTVHSDWVRCVVWVPSHPPELLPAGLTWQTGKIAAEGRTPALSSFAFLPTAPVSTGGPWRSPPFLLRRVL